MKKINIICTLILLCAIGGFAAFYWNYIQRSDNLGPTISIDEETMKVSVKDGEEVFLEGVTAYDLTDGDVTDGILVENVTDFIEKDTRQVTFAAFDRDNHVCKATRRIVYKDYRPAEFHLDGPLRFAATEYSVDILGRVHADDCLDGDLSRMINFSENSTVTVNSPGVYKVTLEVTNSAGDTAKLPVNITMYDSYVENALPQITLSDYIVYTNKGKEVDALKYVESVKIGSIEYTMTDGDDTYSTDTTYMTSRQKKAFLKEPQTMNYDYIQVTDGVNYEQPGVYEIRYSMMDQEDNEGNMTLVVVVREDK